MQPGRPASAGRPGTSPPAGEQQVRCCVWVDTRIQAAARARRAVRMAPSTANVQRAGLVRRMVSGGVPDPAGDAGAVGGGSPCATRGRRRTAGEGRRRTSANRPARLTGLWEGMADMSLRSDDPPAPGREVERHASVCAMAVTAADVVDMQRRRTEVALRHRPTWASRSTEPYCPRTTPVTPSQPCDVPGWIPAQEHLTRLDGPEAGAALERCLRAVNGAEAWA